MKRRLAAWCLGALFVATPLTINSPVQAQEDVDERVVLSPYYSGNGACLRRPRDSLPSP